MQERDMKIAKEAMALNRRQVLLGGTALAAGLGVGALGGTSVLANATTRIGFDHPYNIVPLWSTIMDHAKVAASELSAELLIAVDDARLDKQLANLQGWIAQGVPAMTVFPLEITALEPVAKSALDAGLVWVTYAGEMENQSGAILLNNRESGMQVGRAAGEWFKANHTGVAKAVLIEFREAGTIGIERSDGMREGLHEVLPDAEIVATQSAADPATALNVMSSILTSRDDINIVLCAPSSMRDTTRTTRGSSSVARTAPRKP
jgi:ABC-type sugar transport system substrate-binding protein